MPGKLLPFLIFAALMAACGPKPQKECPPDNQAACMDSSLGYDANIAAILNARCTPCHATGGVEMSILLTDYKHVSSERMTIGSQLVTCTMPPDGSPQLTDMERAQILDWLSCGAPQ